MQSTHLIVQFASEKIKKQYAAAEDKRIKKHRWNNKYYAVLHIASYSESSIAHFMLCNDAGESWFIDTRDVRIVNYEEYSWDGK